MPLVFVTLNKSKNAGLLNEEWMVLENTGPNVVNAQGCMLTIAKTGQRPRSLGTLDPGFVLKPQEKIRLVTGTPSKKAQGVPPTDKDIRNYHLFLREPVLAGSGTVIAIAHNQNELARAVFAPDAKDGLAKAN